jgi:hypothetical protein
VLFSLAGEKMNAVILQPSYIPWRGFFDQVARADVFVFYDDVQYDKRGWRNRNRIKTPTGPIWLTIPVFSKGAQVEHIPINEIKIVWDQPWNQSHWKSIQYSYTKAPFFKMYSELLAQKFESQPEYLADFTIDLTVTLAGLLGISRTKFLRSSEIPGIEGTKTDRLVAILKKIGATHYISGPSAKDYIEDEKFSDAGITLEYMQYAYPEYPQLYPPFDAQVSVLDLLFIIGPNSMDYIQPGNTHNG